MLFGAELRSLNVSMVLRCILHTTYLDPLEEAESVVDAELPEVVVLAEDNGNKITIADIQ